MAARPPLLAPALAFAVLTVTGIVLNRSVPRPADPAATVLAYYRDHATTVRLSATMVFAASIALAVWVATGYGRLRELDITGPAPAVALVGGVVSSSSLGLCGLVGWVASRSGTLDSAPVARTLADLSFMTGGPGHVVPFALLVAGFAVPILLSRLVSPAVGWTGLVLAGVGVISTLTLLVPGLAYALPVARFGGLIWLIVVSTVLPPPTTEARLRSRG
ncbi:MAG TPA: DUF4386 domain-containing protein [Micromonosporaceae bacterium]|nr:DUF4386 domain-containing protein [Micromonosporaceae bacterium]